MALAVLSPLVTAAAATTAAPHGEAVSATPREAPPVLPSAVEVLSAGARANLFLLTNPVDAVYHGGSPCMYIPPVGGRTYQGHCIEMCDWPVGTYTVGLHEFYQAPGSHAVANDTVTIGYLRAQAAFKCGDAQCGVKTHAPPFSVCATHPSPAAGVGSSSDTDPPPLHDADNQICTSSYIELYRMDGGKNASYLADIVRVLDQEIEMTAKNSTALSSYWHWADALFMGMNPYSRLGNVTGDPKYHDQMFKMFGFAALPGGPYGFWNESAGMFYRDELHKRSHPDVFWSRCQGWVMSALVSAIRFVPEAHPSHPVYLGIFKKMAASVAEAQATDGSWRSSMLNHTYPPDSSGSSFMVFALAYGINAGVLDRAKYLPHVQNGWGWLSTVALHPSGLFGWCQPTCRRQAFCVSAFLSSVAQVSQLGAVSAGAV